MKRYRIKPEFYDSWTNSPNYETASIVDADEIERLSREWGTPIDELMEQVDEI